MKAYLTSCDMKTPTSLSEALSVLDQEPGFWRPFAGGTDLMVELASESSTNRRFLNIWGLSELSGICVKDNTIILKALTTFRDITSHPSLGSEFPLLPVTAQQVGGIAIQNRATIGGNIAHASPTANISPPLLVYDADVSLVSAAGLRCVPYGQFHKDYKRTALKPNELIESIRLPRLPKWDVHWFRKVGPRSAMAIAKVSFAGLARLQGRTIEDIRIAFGSVGPTPLRCRLVEEALRGKTIRSKVVENAIAELHKEISPIDDFRSTKAYRMTVSENLLRHFLEEQCGTGLKRSSI